jgi:hypothetical protein
LEQAKTVSIKIKKLSFFIGLFFRKYNPVDGK